MVATSFTSLTASDNCWVVLGETLTGAVGIPDTYDDDLSNTYLGGTDMPRPILAPLWVDAYCWSKFAI